MGNLAHELGALLDPSSIAVIGASDDLSKPGGRILRHLAEYGFSGTVLAVNMARTTVQGLPALTAVDQLPHGVDLAVVATPAVTVPGVVAGCARRGVRACMVLSSGFGEVDGGHRLQRELVATARAAGIRLLGPNCQGLANLASGAVASFSSSFTNFRVGDGAVAVISQSGAVAGMLAAIQHPPVSGLRYWVATGNEADVTVAELVDAVLDDPAVRVVQVYCEQLADAPRLAAAAAKARRLGKAVLMVKAGTTEAGAVAATSHTGALAQQDEVVDAYLRRHGVVRARSLSEMADLSRVFETSGPARGGRVAIVSNSGGLAVMTADAIVTAGLRIAELTEESRNLLRAQLPPFAATDNPVDVTSQILERPGLLGSTLPILAADPGVDAILVVLGVIGPTYDVAALVDAVSAAHAHAASFGVVVAAASVGGHSDLRDRLTARGVPAFDDDAACVRAVVRFVEHSTSTHRPPTVPERHDVTEADVPLPSRGGADSLSERASKDLMESWGLPVVTGRLVRDPAAASEAATELGYPVVVKICAPTATHKTELGGVHLGLTDSDATAAAADAVLAAARSAGLLSVEGVLVEKMVYGGVEMSIGATWDPVFGPTVMVGSGGVEIETLRDFQLLIPPLSADAVVHALTSLRIYPRLQGFRGSTPADVDALVDLVLRFSHRYANTGGALPEIDLNPVIVLDEGALVVDALVRTSDADTTEEA